MALVAADVAAMTATLALKRGRYILTTTQRTRLLEFFSSTGRTASELSLDMIEVAADGSMAEEWKEYAADAGLTFQSDIAGVVRWATTAPGTALTTPDARASVVIDLLTERGVTLSASLAADITATLREVGDAGDARAQSTSSLATCIIYLCELPGEDLVAWHATRVKALSGRTGKVDLRSSLIYQKLHKNTSKTTLERALLDRDLSNRKLSTVKELVTQHLYAASLPLAATQWQRVLGWAAQHFRHDPAKEKVYLWGYFFSTYLGLGMPEDRDRDTLIDMSAPVPGGGASAIEAEMRPTIPGEYNPGLGVSHFGLDGGALAIGTNQAHQHSYNGLAELARMLSGMHAPSKGTLDDEDPPIKELAPPKPATQKCQFCHSDHDLSTKCSAMKQALRLKGDWDKEQAAKRRASEAPPAAAPRAVSFAPAASPP